MPIKETHGLFRHARKKQISQTLKHNVQDTILFTELHIREDNVLHNCSILA